MLQYRDTERTDGMGRARFTNLLPASYTLRVTATGHRAESDLVNIQENDRANKKMKLGQE